MRNFLLLIIFLIHVLDANAKTVYASDFGFSPVNATIAFQNAIKSSADTIIIDLQSSDWNVGPNRFNDLKNKVIIFQPGVTLKAIHGKFPNTADCLLNFVRASNIRIFGYGATLQMQKEEYAALGDGEWRHCLAFNNSSDIEVRGLKIKDSGGDGLYVSGDTWHGTQLYSKNILFKDIWCDNNYRQGLSIISAQHMHVQNCWFTNTSGTLPMSGVDLEPDNIAHRLVDIIFEKCRFTGNYGNGIQLAPRLLESTSIPIDVTFRDCYTSGNHNIDNPYAAAEIQIGDTKAGGNVLFERCMAENSQWTAVFVRKSVESYFVNFKNCVFKNVSQNTTVSQYNNPFWFEVTDYSNPCPRFGGAAFTNCLLEFSTNYNFLNTYGEIATSPGLGNVQFNDLTVIHPNPSVTYKTSNGGGSPSSDCIFNFQKFTSAPTTTLEFNAEDNMIECSGKNSLLKAIRTSDNLNYPLGLTYEISGSAQQGSDFEMMNGFMIIPAYTFFQNDTLKVIKDEIVESAENIIVSPNPSSLFNNVPAPMSIWVYDCGATGIKKRHSDNVFSVFPNPATDHIQINFAEDYNGRIQVVNMRGQEVLSCKVQGRVIRIDTNVFESGYYLVRVIVNERYFNQKLIKI